MKLYGPTIISHSKERINFSLTHRKKTNDYSFGIEAAEGSMSNAADSHIRDSVFSAFPQANDMTLYKQFDLSVLPFLLFQVRLNFSSC